MTELHCADCPPGEVHKTTSDHPFRARKEGTMSEAREITETIPVTVSREIITAVEFDVRNTMIVADPCYIDNDDLPDLYGKDSCLVNGGYVLKKAHGIWVAKIEVWDNGQTFGWGDRVAKLTATRKGHGLSLHEREVGVVGVDSGQMFMGCKTGLPLDYDALLAHKYPGGIGSNGEDRDHKLIAWATGAISHTGYGDGGYPVTVAYDSEQVPCEITVTFISEDDEDESY